VALLTLLSAASTSSAATFYVAAAGSDTNPGTLSAPFRTITRAAAAVRPGDVVEVRGGVYNEVVRLFNSKGTAAARIIFRNYAGEQPVIDGTGTLPRTDLVQLSTTEYTDFTGFEVRNSTGLGITVFNAKGIRLTDNRVRHSTRNGIYIGSDPFGATSDVLVQGNDVYNNVLDNQAHTRSGGWGQAIGIDGADGVTISNNRVHENDGEGIAFVNSDNVVARGNTVYDNFSVGIYFDNAQFCTADANFIYSSGNPRYFRDGLPAGGIGFANEVYSVANLLTDNRVTNNIAVNTRWSVFYTSVGGVVGGGLKNTLVSNNTFYKAATAMLSIDTDLHAGNVVQNNIFHQTGGGAMFHGSAIVTTFRTNLWYGGTPGAAAGAGDVVGEDPLFVRTGGLAATDYKLTHLSYALFAGTVTSAVLTDFWGSLRSPAYDIGAHEHSLPLGSGAATPRGLRPVSDLVARALIGSDVALSWSANEAAAYLIYRDGVRIARTTASAFVDRGLVATTRYLYEVTAVDTEGNESRPVAAYVTTNPEIDREPPTAPRNVSALSLTERSLVLGWSASADNVAVTGYMIYRDDSHIASTVHTRHEDHTVSPGTTYHYRLVAIDAEGNRSAKSPVLAVTTPASRRRITR
jgi:parallel beta-helix repeat protein